MVYSSFNEEMAVAYATQEQLPRATALAKQLKLPINNQAPQKLLVTEEKLWLVFEGMSPLAPDFSSNVWKKRRQAGKKQGLVRACKPSEGLHILDTTAGWGRDASILASFGAKVTLLERNPIIAALLADALSNYMSFFKQSSQEDKQKEYQLQLDFHPIDAFDYLENLSLSAYPDIIYIDPMHPKRHKTALVKKNMQVLQQVLENEENQNEVIHLLSLARQKAKKKVVLKWPQYLPPVAPPHMSISEKTIRFDIYLI